MEKKRTAITGIIKQNAISNPEKTALIIHDVPVSYGELYEKICSAAAFLQAAGVHKGSHVVTVACPELVYIVCEYAILGLGAVNIPTENRIPADRLGEIAVSVDAEFVLSSEKPSCSAKWIAYDEVDTNSPSDLSWEPAPITDDCAEIIFTTGTTGKSKGVMLSMHCLEVYLAAINPSFGIDENSVFLVTTPLNHVGGLHRVHQCMSVGCTAVLLDGIRNLKEFFRSIDEYGVTHTYLPPASVKMLITLDKKGTGKTKRQAAVHLHGLRALPDEGHRNTDPAFAGYAPSSGLREQ
uniref:AMP-dependent synthetase and ligase n=1 Tax=uncultured bacterium Contig248 TaxID=1393544 RepID=W0FIC4_9BACT|nr:AMP-dependent synthetase and ligase [uncultured bacterium Contig248]